MTICIDTVDQLMGDPEVYPAHIRWGGVKFRVTTSYAYAIKYLDDNTRTMWKIQFELIALIFKKVGEPFGFIRHIGPTHTYISLIIIDNKILFEFNEDYYLRATCDDIEILPTEDGVCDTFRVPYSNPNIVNIVANRLIDLEKFFRYVDSRQIKQSELPEAMSFDEFISSIGT